MTYIEIEGASDAPRREQRAAHLFTLALAAVLFAFGLNMRNGMVNATTPYVDSQAGIRLNYPRNWLIETNRAGEDDFVFRVRDTSRPGFKTTIQVSIEPVGLNTTERNVLDALSLRRSTTLATYRVLGVDENVVLPDDVPAFAMDYTFVATDPNPFLESIPLVVRGLDLLILSRGQALIITFRADARTYEDDLAIFNRFINSLEF